MGIRGSRVPPEDISYQIDKYLKEDKRKPLSDVKVLLLGMAGSGKRILVRQMKISHLDGYTPQALLFSRVTPEDISHQIDKNLVEDGRRSSKDAKVLLLGTAGSGKTTLVRQMEIVHLGGYTLQALLSFRLDVYKNLVESAQDVVLAIKMLGVDYADVINHTHAEKILSYTVDSDPSALLDPEISLAITSLINDPVIPSVLDQSHTFYLMDFAEYFFSHVQRIGARDYIPTETDVLRTRIKTTGITETKFNLGQLSICILDVGGQRSERKKWIHCFENVTNIIFCAAISDYDQVLLEESSQNRMDESLILFESVVNSRWFTRTSILLFLTKVDVFRAKLKKSPLERYFPEYTGGGDINKAAKYLLWRFQQMNRKPLMMYAHLTQATDTSNIRLVFSAVKETLLQNALRESGIL